MFTTNFKTFKIPSETNDYDISVVVNAYLKTANL